MKTYSITILVFFFLTYIHAQNGKENAKIDFTVFLIGDSGEYTNAGSALKDLGDSLKANPNSAVIYLGDNIYKKGLEYGKNEKANKKKIDVQLDQLKCYKGTAIFVAGNHDWKNGKKNGFEVLENQEKYIDEKKSEFSSLLGLLPKAKTPGPEVIYFESFNITMILIDSQWLISKSLKNKLPVDQNNELIEEKFWDNFKMSLKSGIEKGRVIIAAHHPLFSIGKHGNKSQFLDFLLGWLGRYSSQELYGSGYSDYIEKMTNILSDSAYLNKGIIYAAGHEHSIQHWRKNGNHFIISGSGSKSDPMFPKLVNQEWNKDAVMDFPNDSIYTEIPSKIKGKSTRIGYTRIDFLDSNNFEFRVSYYGWNTYYRYSEYYSGVE